jgi:hypothetical protein
MIAPPVLRHPSMGQPATDKRGLEHKVPVFVDSSVSDPEHPFSFEAIRHERREDAGFDS